MIGRGVQDRRTAFHTPVLSTSSPDGPQARVLVLRAVDVPTRCLTFHTDTRSAKLPELAGDARVALTFYDAARKTQVRINGVVTVNVGNALSHQRWAAARPSSLRCFAGAQPGGQSAVPTSGLPARLEGREPELSELLDAELNFAVLTVKALRLEWLHLHSRGQRRAAFTWPLDARSADYGDQCTLQWLNP